MGQESSPGEKRNPSSAGRDGQQDLPGQGPRARGVQNGHSGAHSSGDGAEHCTAEHQQKRRVVAAAPRGAPAFCCSQGRPRVLLLPGAPRAAAASRAVLGRAPQSASAASWQLEVCQSRFPHGFIPLMFKQYLFKSADGSRINLF